MAHVLIVDTLGEPAVIAYRPADPLVRRREECHVGEQSYRRPRDHRVPGQSVSPAPGLSVVELEVCSRCKPAVLLLPGVAGPDAPGAARMSDEVFLRAVDQLEQVSFAGRISYHLYNEPLLRTDWRGWSR